MKKIFKCLLFILFIFMPIIIFADEIKVSCGDGKIGPNGEINCTIKGVSNDFVGVNATLSVGSNLSITKVVKASGLSGNVTTSGIELSGNKSGTFDIATVTLKATNNPGVTSYFDVNGVSFKNSSMENVNVSSVKTDIKIKSVDASLKSLSVEGYKLSPSFSSGTLNYKVSAEDVVKVIVHAEAKDSTSKVKISGNTNLKYGDNTVKIVVTSESGKTTTYKIIVNRFDSRDKVNTLNNLVVAGYDLNKKFDQNVTSYSVSVEPNVTNVSIQAERTSAKSTFVKGYGPRKVNLKYGLNKVYIKVKAENEVVKNYLLNITRIDDRDTNNYLKELKLSNGYIKFDKDNQNYIINVENNVEVLTLGAVPESLKATVKYTRDNELKVGSNKIIIEVTAENEKTRKYNLTVNRLREGTTVEELEKIFYVKKFEIENKQVTFNQRVLEYEVPITNDKYLTFNYELYDGVVGSLEIKDDNNEIINLNSSGMIDVKPIYDGTVIYLHLTSKEGYSKDYKYNVKKAEYYYGGGDGEKEKLEIHWTWQLIVGLASSLVIVAEMIIFIINIIKKDANKGDAVQEKLLDNLKKIKFKKN